MQKNYIILAHKNPMQLKRLVERLDDYNTYFYIHIDKSFDITAFRSELLLSNVCFVEQRVNSIWGDVGAVLATINCLREILNDSRNGYCILLSGQDYPIKTNDAINAFLLDNYGANFIQMLPVETAWPYDEWYKRLNKYKFNLSGKRDDYILLPWFFSKDFFIRENIRKFIKYVRDQRSIQIINVLRKRQFPKNSVPYGGSQWWALTTDTVSEILRYLEKNRSYLRYHRFTLLSDEIFFQSILNHIAKNNNGMVFKPPLTYVNWTRKNVTLPVIFTSSDLDELVNQPASMLFARKFDVEVDSTILEMIDNIHNIILQSNGIADAEIF
jgi:hypothetical protein